MPESGPGLQLTGMPPRGVIDAVSLYQLHRCVYDYVRAGEISDGGDADGRKSFDAGRYELSDDERKAFDTKDVAALYQLGLHAVLLNRFCRAVGYARDDYRKMLEPFGVPEERKARWQK
ncbi:MAG: hypothetical protein V7646_1400 [Pseudonocardia sp.]